MGIDQVIDTGVPGTMIDLIKAWDALKPGLEAKAAAGGGVPLTSVKLESPVQRPGKIFAIGLNYADHIEESKMGTPERQVWFTKAVTSVNAPGDPVLIAAGTACVDYEVELVAVIGKQGKHIARADAAGLWPAGAAARDPDPAVLRPGSGLLHAGARLTDRRRRAGAARGTPG